MAMKKLPKKADPVNHITVGFSFPDRRNTNETISCCTRHSIWLGLSSQIYARLVDEYALDNLSALTAEKARKAADAAFDLTDIYLAKLDKEVARLSANEVTVSDNNNK